MSMFDSFMSGGASFDEFVGLDDGGVDFGDLFDTVGDYASKAFDWMEANPTATGAIAGAASAGLQYMSAKEQQEYYEKKLKQEERFNARRPSSGGNGYSSHTTNLTGGTGLLANPYRKSGG